MVLYKHGLRGLVFLCAMALAGLPSVVVGDSADSITEAGCARLEEAEIIWDLSRYRWMCCIPKNEDEYETCIPISDMRPLPKTSLKPFPPGDTRTTEKTPPKP